MVEFVDDEKEGEVFAFSERTRGMLFKWGAILLSIVIMLSHWYIFYVFSHNTQEVLSYSGTNEICIAWIYTLIYLVIPIALILVTFTCKWVNLFKIPFVYFVFVNVERCYYGSWLCTNEMIDTHYILIYCILCLYAMEIIGILWKNSRFILSLPKKLIQYISNRKTEYISKDIIKYNSAIDKIEGGTYAKV